MAAIIFEMSCLAPLEGVFTLLEKLSKFACFFAFVAIFGIKGKEASLQIIPFWRLQMTATEN